MTHSYPNFVMRKPHRVSLTLPDSAFQELIALSNAQGRSLSNLAAFLLEVGLERCRQEQRRDQRDSA